MIPELNSAIDLVNSCNRIQASIEKLINENWNALRSLSITQTETPHVKYSYYVPENVITQQRAQIFRGWSVDVKAVIESCKVLVAQLEDIPSVASLSERKRAVVGNLKKHVEDRMGTSLSFELDDMYTFFLKKWDTCK